MGREWRGLEVRGSRRERSLLRVWLGLLGEGLDVVWVSSLMSAVQVKGPHEQVWEMGVHMTCGVKNFADLRPRQA